MDKLGKIAKMSVYTCRFNRSTYIMNKYIFVALITVFVSGCGTTPYKPPSSDKAVAYVTFEPSGDPLLGYTAFLMNNVDPRKSGCYSDKHFMANVNNGNPLSSKTNNPENIPVLANKKIVLTAVFAPANILHQYGCRYNIELIPKENMSYEIPLRWEDTCEIQVFEGKGDNMNISESAIIKKTRC